MEADYNRCRESRYEYNHYWGDDSRERKRFLREWNNKQDCFWKRQHEIWRRWDRSYYENMEYEDEYTYPFLRESLRSYNNRLRDDDFYEEEDWER